MTMQFSPKHTKEDLQDMKLSRYIAVLLSLALILAAVPMAALAEGPDRISGDNRYLTAVAVSQAGWEKSDIVILARGDQYADALTGVSLAHKLEAPILLTTSNALHEAAQAEIIRLEAKEIVILGGTSAVSQGVEDMLKSLDLTVRRISGVNRYATAAAIAAEVTPEGTDTAVVAFGENFPDALAVASYAAAAGYPILLTRQNTLPQETLTALAALDVQNTIVVGGPSAVSSAVFAQLPEPVRVYGANRYATAVAVAEHFDVQADHFYLATGLGFADAITGSVLAAKDNTGLLLTDRQLPQAVADFITENRVRSITVLGGPGSVSDEVLAAVADLLNKASAYTLTIEGPDVVVVNQAAEFSVRLKGDESGILDLDVTLEYAITGGTGVLEYQAGEEWFQLPLTGTFGPSGGFTITPDWDETTQLRFTAAQGAVYSVAISLKDAQGEEITGITKEVATAAGVVPEEFAVTARTDINYFGYSVGFLLVDGLTPADLSAIEVSLYKEGKLLAANTAKEALFALTDLQHTSPFNVYGEFENYTEAYWNLGEWQGELLDIPDEAIITVTLTDGREITIQNTNLTGNLGSIIPKVWNIQQAKAYAGIQAAIAAADPGDTLLITAGTHAGPLNITKSINLVGLDQETVIIDTSAATAYGIYVKADSVSFSNFTLLAPTQAAAHAYGFKVEDSSNISFDNVTVKDSYRSGIDLNKVSNAVLDNVTVQGAQYGAGIALTECTEVTITNTSALDNAWGGIAIYTTGEGIVLGGGNDIDFLYTQGADFDLDLSSSAMEYKLVDTANPAFTWYFAEAPIQTVSATMVLSNLQGSEFYVLEGMSIQAAVDMASDDATIIVGQGEYSQDIVITTPGLTVAGEGTAILQGTVKILADNVTITGLILYSEKPGAIIQIAGADNTVIEDNIILSDGTAMGIVLDTGTATHVLIQGNILRFLHSGVYIHRGENVAIISNDFSDIAEGAVSIETWAKNVVIEENYVFFSSSLVYFWSQYYSDQLVFADEVVLGENELRHVNYLIAPDQN